MKSPTFDKPRRIVAYGVEVDYGRGESQHVGFFARRQDAEAVADTKRESTSAEVYVYEVKPYRSIEEFRGDSQ